MKLICCVTGSRVALCNNPQPLIPANCINKWPRTHISLEGLNIQNKRITNRWMIGHPIIIDSLDRFERLLVTFAQLNCTLARI